jgi:hypothetical protein
LTTWLGAFGAVVVITAASWWMVRLHRLEPRHRARRDPHWGDWPPDQMAR